MNFDPHKNIFYYYRGPSNKTKNKYEKIIYDTQIEDNTTKALINCLEKCDDDLLKFFLTHFKIDLPHKDKPQFLLQVSKKRSRPDAEIKTVKKSIIIESKIDSPVSIEQLKNHLEGIKDKDILILITKESITDDLILNFLKAEKITHIKWAEIKECFSCFKTNSTKDLFLINEFINYLEVMGLTTFNGFTNDDFDFFINRIDEYKPILRDKVLAIF